MSLVTHSGSCHCQAVQFEVDAPSDVVVWICNCSICHMKQNHHLIVPASKFRLLRGHDSLTTYTFGTHTAKHQFCKKCGVQAFYIPRSNPDGYAITLYCLGEDTISSVEKRYYDGKHWEKSHETSNIADCSKE